MVIGKLTEYLEHFTSTQHQHGKITNKPSSTEQAVKLNMCLSKLHAQLEFPILPSLVAVQRAR